MQNYTITVTRNIVEAQTLTIEAENYHEAVDKLFSAPIPKKGWKAMSEGEVSVDSIDPLDPDMTDEECRALLSQIDAVVLTESK